MTAPGGASGRGGFFAVDEASWGAALTLGLNPAVAYLTMAAGTGRGQRRTPWSVNAIEHHAGIGRKRASEAVNALCGGNLVRIEKGGTKPIYDIGLPAEESQEPRRLIWMPVSFVRGSDPTSRKASPLAKVRQARNIEILKLAISLYAFHDLANEGGIDRRILCQRYKGTKIYERGQYAVWSFLSEGMSASQEDGPGASFVKDERYGGDISRVAEAFWGAVRILRDLRIIEFVPIVCEAGRDGEPIFSLSPTSHIPAERASFIAAREAGLALLPSALEGEAAETGAIIVPVLRHHGEVELAGVCRLTHRPHTTATAAWWAKMQHLDAIIEEFCKIVTSAGRPVPQLIRPAP